MGNAIAGSEEPAEPEEPNRFDIFYALPRELQWKVLWYLLSDDSGVDAVGAMMGVTRRWNALLTTLPLPMGVAWEKRRLRWAGIRVVPTVTIQRDVRQMIRAIREDRTERTRPAFSDGAVAALGAAAEMYGVELLRVANKCAADRHPAFMLSNGRYVPCAPSPTPMIKVIDIRRAVLAMSGQAPLVAEAVFGPAEADRRKRRRHALMDECIRIAP